MVPVREQLRMAGRFLLWLVWSRNLTWWANAVGWMTVAAMVIWFGARGTWFPFPFIPACVIAAFASWYGKKGKR
jgi:hypothetical protein